MLGIIGGSSFLESKYFKSFEKVTKDTPYGSVVMQHSSNVIFVQRHKTDPVKEYLPPHKINFKAIVHSLKEMKCHTIIAFCSAGSLHKKISIGSLLIPHDYINLTNTISFFDDIRRHIVPGFCNSLRKKIIYTLKSSNFDVISEGVYCQMKGPRFETPAEVQFLSTISDIVGMTVAYEASLCNELSLPYACIATVYNYANGINERLSVELYVKGENEQQKQNERVLYVILKEFSRYSLQNDSRLLKRDTDSRQDVDLIVNAKYIVPIEPDEVLYGHSLVVKDGRIFDILPFSDVSFRYNAAEVIEKPEHVLMPGFINAHTHVGMSLLRGYANDVKFQDQLNVYIKPIENEQMSADQTKDGTDLGIAEMIRSGTTMFNEMYFFPGESAERVHLSGMRATIAIPFINFTSKYADNFEDYMEKGLKVFEKFKDHKRIRFSVGPHSPGSVSDENLKKCQIFARKHNLTIHTHLHENLSKVKESVIGNKNSSVCHYSNQLYMPIENFERLGLLNESLVAAHVIDVSDEQIALLSKRKVSVVICSTSNMKLVIGSCPVVKLLDSNVNVAIGTDSCGSINSLNMIAEIKTAALFGKLMAGDASKLSAHQVLRMATLNGAKALGVDNNVGSLRIGKYADFISISLNILECQPVYDVLSIIVYSTTRENITDVWVEGRQLMKDRNLLTLNEQEIINKVRAWEERNIIIRNRVHLKE